MEYTDPLTAPNQIQVGQHELIGNNSDHLCNAYDLVAIAPCVSTNISDDAELSQFHLLTCGHIILVDNPDHRCGRTCDQAFQQPTVQSSRSPLQPHSIHDPNTLTFTNLSRPHEDDALYCEVCTGIPFDKYCVMFPLPIPTNNGIFIRRRCLSITRSLIASTTVLPMQVVQSLLCPLFYRAGGVPHDLRCGHRVWCLHQRPCGVNRNVECRMRYGVGRADVLFCDECVRRAEWVHERYERARRM